MIRVGAIRAGREDIDPVKNLAVPADRTGDGIHYVQKLVLQEACKRIERQNSNAASGGAEKYK